VRQVSGGSIVLAASLPLIFLHVRYQPSVSVPFGGTFKLQDAAVLAVGVTAAVVARREGLQRLRPALPIWIALGAFLIWIVAACFYPLLGSGHYAWRTHFVTAVEYCEYAVLAPAVPLLIRRRADAVLGLSVLAVWTAVAAIVALLQWLGFDIADAWPQGYRQPSFLGHHDFTALCGMTLATGLVAVLWHEQRRGVALAIALSCLGFALGGSSAGVIGLAVGAAVAAFVAFRRRLLDRRAIAALLASIAVVGLGVAGLRARDFDQFARFLGVAKPTTSTSSQIQTYSQRTLLAYIGFRIWLDHPVVGAGWQGSKEPAVIRPTLPAAHARFPTISPAAFPGPGRDFGVQILYVQVLADLGIVGFLLLVGLIGTTVVAGARAALRAPPGPAFAATLGLFWLAIALGLWTALGLVAGIPLDAVTWLSVGAIAASAARASGRMAA
jgi:hypothetical protein